MELPKFTTDNKALYVLANLNTAISIMLLLKSSSV